MKTLSKKSNFKTLTKDSLNSIKGGGGGGSTRLARQVGVPA